MSLTLYGTGPSRSFRCLWALEESGLSFEYINLDLASDGKFGAKSDDYLKKLNIQGKVPTLRHDDFVLTESGAILNYLDQLAGNQFIPQSPKARARYDELAFFILTELEQPLWTKGKHKFAIPEAYRLNDIFTTAEWEFEKAVSALERLTNYTPYALGDQFTFADILLAQTLNWADRFKFRVPDPLLAYRDRLYSRAAAQRALANFTS
jgi:glutathione S-transferase